MRKNKGNMKTELDYYLEWNKAYDKAISKLMKLSNKKLINEHKEQIIELANNYISKFTQQYYIDRIIENKNTITENF